jgi:hypothetical protein
VRATFKALAPDSIDMSMTVTMPLGEWKKLRGQIEINRNVWPLCDFVANVEAAINAAEKHFEAMEDRRRG